jgi:hypothetical protein
LRKRAKILVIDDQALPAQRLFERDGYHFERWAQIKNLSQLTDNHYDIILLDVQGVGLVWVPSQAANSLIIIWRISRGVYAVRGGGTARGTETGPTEGTGEPATRRGLLRIPVDCLRAGMAAPPSWGSYALFQA